MPGTFGRDNIPLGYVPQVSDPSELAFVKHERPDARRSVSPARLKRSMSSTFRPTCSSCGAFPLASCPTTDRSSSPGRCRNGSRLSVPRPSTSIGAAPGRAPILYETNTFGRSARFVCISGGRPTPFFLAGFCGSTSHRSCCADGQGQ
jgi:hypothetical protein